MTERRTRASVRAGARRGAVRVRGGGFWPAFKSWLADRTIRRKWRRLSVGEWLVVLVAVLVAGAFLMLLQMQALWLAGLVALVLALYLYRELGA